MTIFLASNNKHKKQEISTIFAPHEILIPSDKEIKFNPEETGTNFVSNSLIKAENLWNIVHEPVIADDSGLCVDVLNDRPGIFSARYAGKNDPIGAVCKKELEAKEKNILLLEEVNEKIQQLFVKNPSIDINDITLRACHYVCSMVLYIDKDNFYCIQETMKGYLVKSIEESSGVNGFGFDPIVFLPDYNKTVAEISPEEKNRISHRGKACQKLLNLVNSLF